MSDQAIPPFEPDQTKETHLDQTDPGELDNLRSSMAEEEAEKRKAQPTGILKKVTGFLRWPTAKKEEKTPEPAETKPLAALPAPLDEDDRISDEILAQQVGKTFSGWEDEIPLEVDVPTLAEEALDEVTVKAPPGATKPFVMDESAAEPAPAPAAGVVTNPLAAEDAKPEQDEVLWIYDANSVDRSVETRGAGAFTVDAKTDDSIIELKGQDEASPFEMPPAGEVLAEIVLPESETSAPEAEEEQVPDTAETESLRAELNPEPSPEALQPASQKKSTRSLRTVVTNWLNPDAVKNEPADEVADDLIADRLIRSQSNVIPEIPGAHKPWQPFAAEEEAAQPETDEDDDGEAALWKPLVERDRANAARQEKETREAQPAPEEEPVRHNRRAFDRVEPKEETPAEEVAGDDLKPGQGEGQAPPKAPSRLSEMAARGGDDAGPNIEDVRGQALEDYSEPDAAALAAMQPLREPLLKRFQAWVHDHLGTIVGLAVLLVLTVLLVTFKPWNKAPIAQPNTPVPSDLPYPAGLELTGGWFFDINRSTIVKGVWEPKSAEWLDNSQVRRVIALPWNEQTAAVIQTLKGGDPVKLVFSNNDVQTYAVKSVERLDKSDTALFSATDPGLVIFLYNEDSEQRWVVLALPK
jgi:hypothetical protein